MKLSLWVTEIIAREQFVEDVAIFDYIFLYLKISSKLSFYKRIEMYSHCHPPSVCFSSLIHISILTLIETAELAW